MEISRLIYKLKEFYTLETYQLDLYKSQVNTSEDDRIKMAFERFSVREQEHVDFYRNKLAEYGEGPPTLVSTVFSAAGLVSGKAVGILNQKNSFELGSAVEKKAVEMYYDFIQEASMNPDLAELIRKLWYFMVDEETHQFWFDVNIQDMEVGNHYISDNPKGMRPSPN